MRIGLAQINSTLGDFAKNREKIIESCNKALSEKCDLVVFPEMALFGYHPMDLLERKNIVATQIQQFKILEKRIPKGITALVGMVLPNPTATGKPFFNSAALIEKNKPTRFFHKSLLPTYDVFDETRHFEVSHPKNNIFKFKNKKILVTICEDIWAWPTPKGFSPYAHNPLKELHKEKIDLVLNLSASPFTEEKITLREHMIIKTAQHFKAPLIYVNLIGGQDELIFDGGSKVVNAKGKVIYEGTYFQESFGIVETDQLIPLKIKNKISTTEKIRQALVLGIRDYVNKIGFKEIHLGLSGGIDSAVIACLAAEAIGPNRVTCIGLPGPFNDSRSLDTARQLSQNLKCKWIEIPIIETYETVLKNLVTPLAIEQFGFVNENLQARIRGLFLMAFSNRYGSLLLTTGNKSEYATGYTTLYGDMCGGLAPIGDLLKRKVYDLARSYNQTKEIIPDWIITRPPSAELRPDQKDEDSLPPYTKLDLAVHNLVEEYKAPRNETEKWVITRLMSSEFKRWQAPPILKISNHAFGRGRRFPIAHRAYI